MSVRQPFRTVAPHIHAKVRFLDTTAWTGLERGAWVHKVLLLYLVKRAGGSYKHPSVKGSMSSSLSSAMFAGYNKFDDAKVRIGSWREELALKELTGVTRLANPRDKAVFNATDIR